MITGQHAIGVLRRFIRRTTVLAAFAFAFASSATAATLTIAWDPSPEPEVVGYIVYVGTTAGNYTTSFDVGNTTTFDFTAAVPGTTYHLAVRAYASPTVMSPYSNNLVAAVTAVPAAPTRLSPSGTTTTATPTFTWSAVANAETYFLWVDDAQQTGRIRQVYTAAQAGCGAGTGTCSVAPAGSLAGGSASWKVLAANSAGDSPWSAVASFTVSGSSPTPAPAPPPSSSLTVVPHSGWSLKYVDSQEPGGGYDAANVFDDNPATMWHTQWSAASPMPPHELQIDLGRSHALGGFRYLPRQDGNSNGAIGLYQFFVSADGVNWGTPVAVGSFAPGSGEQQVTFALTTGRYIRLRAMSELGGRAWTSIAELNVLAQPSTSNPPPASTLIPRSAWKVHYVDSQETAAGAFNASYAFDGNPATIWHTQWAAASPLPPHELQIDLGATYSVAGFRYLPRQDGNSNGNIGRYEVYTSADGVNWGTAAASGTFSSGSAEQQVTFAARSARYVRLRALTEINGRAWTAVSELQVLGSAQ